MVEKTINVPAGAGAGNMNKVDWIKVAKGAGIAMGGAAVVYISELLANNTLDLTPMWVAVASTLVNMAKLWLTNNSVSATPK